MTDRSGPEPSVRVDAGPRAATYRVKSGDTLYSIAFESGVDYRELAAWNGIGPPYLIRPGQKLRLTPAFSAKTRPTAAPTRPMTPAPAAIPDATPIRWAWPADGPVVREPSGSTTSRGLEIAGREGAPVRAAAAGKVVYAGSGLRGYGELIIVKHDETFLSAYAHNKRLLVQEGHQVKGGQVIAEMGRSDTTQVKLHFEIRRSGVPVDPTAFLPPR